MMYAWHYLRKCAFSSSGNDKKKKKTMLFRVSREEVCVVELESPTSQLDLFFFIDGPLGKSSSSHPIPFVEFSPHASLSFLCPDGPYFPFLYLTSSSSDGSMSLLPWPNLSHVPLCRWVHLTFSRHSKGHHLRLQLCTSHHHHHREKSRLSPHYVSFPKWTSLRIGSWKGFVSFSSVFPSFPPDSPSPPPVRISSGVSFSHQLFSRWQKKNQLSPLPQKCGRRSFVPGLLVCHDYKGGYVATDRSQDIVWGDSEAKDPFAYVRWPSTDCFVYFSHGGICVPPVGWCYAAKRNGATMVLGTIITEWTMGERDNLTLLSGNVEECEERALTLAREAHRVGCDGYLINIEANVPQPLLANLAVFLKELQRHCVTIMYDSVCADTGEIVWQNGVTERNAPWLECSDALFINYGWIPATLPNTPNDRYMFGVDCFGRGTYLGGGFQSGKAASIVKSKGFSAALFAPGWTVERKPHDHAEAEFWQGIQWRFHRASMVATSGDFEQDGDFVICSHMWCRRRGQWTSSEFQDVSDCIVRIRVVQMFVGTGPNFADPYEFKAKLSSASALHMLSGKETQVASGVCTKDLQQIVLEWVVAVGKEGLKDVTVEVQDGGRDAENWGGHYGTRLKKEVQLHYCCTSWPLSGCGVEEAFPPRVPCIESIPFHSWFCIGAGNRFFVEGVCKRDECWSNMGLQSMLPSQYWAKDGFSEFSSVKAFSFGSSLRICCANSNARVPLFQRRFEEDCVVRVSFTGDEVVLFSNNVLLLAQQSTRQGEWTVKDFCWPAAGALTCCVEGETYLGLLEVFPLQSKKTVPRIDRVDVKGSFHSRGLEKHLVEWSLVHPEWVSCLDIVRDGKWLARVLPDSPGYFDEEGSPKESKYEILLRGI